MWVVYGELSYIIDAAFLSDLTSEDPCPLILRPTQAVPRGYYNNLFTPRSKGKEEKEVEKQHVLTASKTATGTKSQQQANYNKK
ncbi:hypothetical protein SK128_019413 [Halocaridina rubra]|uniref:Uncharacterized protein n=1 Tax=Halocaridina rubra TaxID=373956 RepID=A0AAN8WLW5_HALRR